MVALSLMEGRHKTSPYRNFYASICNTTNKTSVELANLVSSVRQVNQRSKLTLNRLFSDCWTQVWGFQFL